MQKIPYDNDLTAKQLALKIAHIAEEKKGFDINIMDMRKLSSLADYLVLINGLNEKHLKALVSEIEFKLKKESSLLCKHIDGIRDSAWIVLDYFDVIVHLFMPEQRTYYGLERLWADAPVIKRI